MSLRVFFEEIKNFDVLNKIKDADVFVVAKSLVNVQSIVKFIQWDPGELVWVTHVSRSADDLNPTMLLK